MLAVMMILTTQLEISTEATVMDLVTEVRRYFSSPSVWLMAAGGSWECRIKARLSSEGVLMRETRVGDVEGKVDVVSRQLTAD